VLELELGRAQPLQLALPTTARRPTLKELGAHPMAYFGAAAGP